MPDLLAQAIAHHRAGRLADAEPLYRRVLAAKPDQFDALHMLGVIRQQQGRHGEALDLIGAALEARPGSAWALSNYGVVLLALERHGEAVASLQRALTLNPGDPETLNNLGNALLGGKQYDAALARYDEVLALKPDFAEAHNSRGNVLQETGRLDAALASYAQALALKPDYAQAFYNRGAALHALNRHADAVASYQRALAIDPDYADAHWNESLARLCGGDLAAGFEKFEWRWRTSDADAARQPLPGPLWLGREELQGKTILLYGEQGVGDTLQFVRYAPLVAGRGAKVVLAVHAELKSLLSGMRDTKAFTDTQVFAEGEPLPPFDLRCPLLSLPLAFGTTLASIPAEVPYLRASEELAARWRARLPATRSLRVGLVWSGSPTHKNDRNRSIGLQRLEPILTVPDAQFVSLQKDARAADQDYLRQHPGIIDIGRELGDFADTAAVVAELDLVLAVDTAVVHLAGAMAKPVWVLLPFSPDWRWLIGRDDSPWYPTARLFRQPAMGDWTSVVARVAEELENYSRAAVASR